MDVVEKVARALKKAGFSEDWQHANECTRAAIAAMLEAVGEPVAWKYEDDEVRYVYLDGPQKHLINVGLPETPLYPLSPLTQALAASDPPHNRP